MCDSCSFSIGDKLSIDSNNPTKMIKCQVSNSSAYRELFMYYHLDHPNIPSIEDVTFIQDRNVHFTMNRLMPFSKWELTLDQRRKIFLDLVDTVAYLQSRGIYHQNIRPGNIMLDNDNIPYLVNYQMACSEDYSTSCWNSPTIVGVIGKGRVPTKEQLLKGDSWSLGLLGLYLFSDISISQFDYSNEDISQDYLPEILRGYFLHLDKFSTKNIPSDILRVIKALLRGTLVTTNYDSDPLRYSEFSFSIKDQRDLITLYYSPIVRSKESELEKKLADLMKLPTETKQEVVKLVKSTLDLTESLVEKKDKIKVVCFTYNYALPLAYDKFTSGDPELNFWQTSKRKLLEFSQENIPEIDELVRNKLPEIEDIIGSFNRPTPNEIMIRVVPMGVPNKYHELDHGFVIVQDPVSLKLTVIGVKEWGTDIRPLTEQEKYIARSLGVSVL